MHPTKPYRARRARLLVPSALAVVILSGAAAPAGAVEGDRGAARQQLETTQKRAAAGPIDDLVNGILDAIKGLLPPGISLPDIKIPPIELPEIKLPEIPGVELPEIPGVEIPELPPLIPPTLPDPAAPVEIVPELPDFEIPEIPEIPDLP